MLPKKLFFRALLALFVGTCLIVVWAYLNFLSDLKSFRSVYKAFNLISEETSFPKLDPSMRVQLFPSVRIQSWFGLFPSQLIITESNTS